MAEQGEGAVLQFFPQNSIRALGAGSKGEEKGLLQTRGRRCNLKCSRFYKTKERVQKPSERIPKLWEER